MYAIHSTLLAPSAIHHTLYLPHFTPSTIYPIPRPSSSTLDIKVIGNLIVGGISDLRVFEIREESRPVLPNGINEVNGNGGAGGEREEGMVDGEEVGDGFLDNGPSHVGLLACIPSYTHSLIKVEISNIIPAPSDSPPLNDASAPRQYHRSSRFADNR